MTTNNSNIKIEQEKIIDDISEKPMTEEKNNESLDIDKLAKLKAKLAAKQNIEENKEDEMPAKIVIKPERSINFGIIGSGQGGSRLAEAFYKLGMDAVVMNTAQQDLKFIDVPESNKLFLEYGLGGASRDLAIGYSAADSHREQILDLVNKQLADSQILIFTVSLGGGSGAGSCDVIIDILSATGKPVMVLAVLPMESEDAQTKHNALITLSKLAKYTQSKKIANLMVVDNSKIELIYHSVSPVDFFNIANRAIVEPLDAFNRLSAMPSSVKPLDPTEFSRILIDGEGLTIYGELKVDNYENNEAALAEAIISNLDSNLLADGFDIKQSKYVGVIISANSNVWKKIHSSSINYMKAILEEATGTPRALFSGVYTTDDPEDIVKIYFIISGLGIPSGRIDVLKKQAQEFEIAAKQKDNQRNLTLNLDTGKDQTVSKIQEIKNKVATKSSAFGKFTTGVVDRRKG